LEVFRRRPLAVWDVCDGRHLKTFTGADTEASALPARCRRWCTATWPDR